MLRFLLAINRSDYLPGIVLVDAAFSRPWTVIKETREVGEIVAKPSRLAFFNHAIEGLRPGLKQLNVSSDVCSNALRSQTPQNAVKQHKQLDTRVPFVLYQRTSTTIQPCDQIKSKIKCQASAR